MWLLDPGDKSPGGFSTPDISEFPSGGGVFSSLPDVLEAGPIPPKYFLSRRACAGVLKRAAKRGKRLAPVLEYALGQQAAGRVTVAEPLEAPVVLTGEVVGTIPARNESGGGFGTDFEAAGGIQVVNIFPQTTHTLKGEGWDGSEDGTGRGRPLAVCAGKKVGRGKKESTPGKVATALLYSIPRAPDRSHGGGRTDGTVNTPGRGVPVAVSLDKRNAVGVAELGGGIANSLLANPGMGDRPMVLARDTGESLAGLVLAVRYLTPLECERLQGIPDNHTLVPWRKGQVADAPRYKAVGNGMAVPCVAWVIKRMHESYSARMRAG